MRNDVLNKNNMDFILDKIKDTKNESFDDPLEPKDVLELRSISKTFDEIIDKDYITDKRRQEIKEAQIISLPEEHFRGYTEKLFHSCVSRFFKSLNEENPEIKTDFCIEKDKYLELDLHSAEFSLGSFILKDILLPIFIDLVKDFLEKAFNISNDDRVNINIIFENKDNENGVQPLQELKYDGKINEMEEKIQKQFPSVYKKDGSFVYGKDYKIDELC